MKTTLDLPEKEIRDAMHFTRSKTKKAAVQAALEDFNQRQRMATLVKHLGTFVSLLSNEEIERRDNTSSSIPKPS